MLDIGMALVLFNDAGGGAYQNFADPNLRHRHFNKVQSAQVFGEFMHLQGKHLVHLILPDGH